MYTKEKTQDADVYKNKKTINKEKQNESKEWSIRERKKKKKSTGVTFMTLGSS